MVSPRHLQCNLRLLEGPAPFFKLLARTFFIGVVSFRSDEKNAKIASGLVQILAGAGVEVPDFLASFGSGGFGGAPASFGGTDIRGGAVASTAYEDEGW